MCKKLNIYFYELGVDVFCTDPAEDIQGRNTIFLANALAIAKNKGFTKVIIGSNADHISIDNSVAYLSFMKGIFKLHNIELDAPLMLLNKKTIIGMAKDLCIDIRDTHSCFTEEICFKCSTCLKIMDALGGKEQYENILCRS